eukprot:12625795-Ditylum_brightwellii.AAC.1
MKGFMYATSLDLNMGYYHIGILPKSSVLCTTVLHWGKHEYLKLPMDIKEIHVYIDDLLLIINGNWDSHLEKLDKVLDRHNCVGLK